MKSVARLVADSVKSFSDEDPLTNCAAIAFYTVLALPALLMLVVKAAGVVFGEEAVSGELRTQISEMMGAEAARQVQNMVRHGMDPDASGIMTIVGVVMLIFSATTVFITVQDALNQIWGVKAIPQNGLRKFIINRLISFSMIISLGFMLMVSLSIDAAISAVSDYVFGDDKQHYPMIMYLINSALSLVVLSFMFAALFKFLPDAIVEWKDARVGAVVTAVLFVVGKFLIGLYIGSSNFSSTYGAAGAIVVILVWVYYSSLILLYGAEFTQVYSRWNGRKIRPRKNAVRIVWKKIETI